MRFQVISDVHTEFHRDAGRFFCENVPVLTSTLVIAGDFALGKNLVDTVSTLVRRFENVIYVCGNHEYYDSPRGQINHTLTKLQKRYSNFHWLNHSSVVIEGQKFVGSTMWFRDHPDNVFYKDLMNDFTVIPAFNKWVYEENVKADKFFAKEVEEGCVVISHHAPCTLSASKRHKDSPTNRFYICDQSNLIREKKPKYWIHGHMHDPVSYQLHDTWVESNPFGYVGFEDTPPIGTYGKVLGD